jgi:hypothetical protein
MKTACILQEFPRKTQAIIRAEAVQNGILAPCRRGVSTMALERENYICVSPDWLFSCFMNVTGAWMRRPG